MRKSKIITVDGRGEVTVKELSPAAVYRAWQDENRMETLRGLLDECVTPGVDELGKWYGSEIDQVVDAFFEVNDAFFRIARKFRADGIIKAMAESIASSLPGAFADSFSLAMQAHGTTAGQSS